MEAKTRNVSGAYILLGLSQLWPSDLAFLLGILCIRDSELADHTLETTLTFKLISHHSLRKARFSLLAYLQGPAVISILQSTSRRHASSDRHARPTTSNDAMRLLGRKEKKKARAE